MKFLVVLMLSSAVFGDVSHLKLNTERTYLPPDSHQRHVEEYHYAVSKPKALHEPERVYVPHNGLNTNVADLPLGQRQLFTPAGEDVSALGQGSDHVLYATAPNSVFHTQINVQSQGNEFNVPKTHAHFEEGEGEEEGRSRSGDAAHSRSYKKEKLISRTYNDEPHKHENARTHDTYSYEHTRTDQPRKRPNYQGLNLINGNIAADTAANLPGPPSNLHGNAQGINILNGNLLGKQEHAHSPQFGYKPEHHQKPKYDERKVEDVYRTHTSHHHEHHDSKDVPRKHDSHKEYDYHRSHDEHYKHGDERGHDYKEHRTHDEHEHHEYKTGKEYDHARKQHDHHEQREHHEHREHHDHHDHSRQYHDHDKPYKNDYDHARQYHEHDHHAHGRQYDDHDHQHHKSFERQHYTSEVHEKPQYQQTVVSKPAVKIIAFNNNNQPHSKLKPVQAHIPAKSHHHDHEEEYDPSASALEVIYKPGDEIDFAETKLIDYQHNRQPLDSYNYIRKKPQQRNQSSKHGDTDLRADGYHYGKPSVSFDS